MFDCQRGKRIVEFAAVLGVEFTALDGLQKTAGIFGSV
jgi:hypothetical protein